jgi:hypothetical protein
VGNKVKIFVVQHDTKFDYKSDVFEPIMVGKKANDPNLNMLTDTKGDNIAEKNSLFAELTALYWVWKNYDADYYGFCHYRRFFNFNKNAIDFEDNKGLNTRFIKWKHPDAKQIMCKIEYVKKFDKKVRKKYNFDDKFIEEFCSQYDVIVPKKFELEIEGFGFNYRVHHIEAHWDLLREVIGEKYPDHVDAFDRISACPDGYLRNIFIMNKKYFNEYMEFLFTVLFEMEKRMAPIEEDVQSRACGFLGERLMNVFLEQKRMSGEKLRIRELPLVKEATYNKPKASFEFAEPVYQDLVKNYTDKKICLYGAGLFAREFINSHDLSSLNIVGALDKQLSKHGEKLGAYDIYHISKLKELNPDVVLVTMLNKNWNLKRYLILLRKEYDLKFIIKEV